MATRALIFLLVTGALAWSPAWPTRWSSPTPCPTNGYGPKPTHTSPPYASGTPVATTKNGTYVGVHNDAYNQDFFLGMPYAQPPVNELRFRTPRSLNTTWSGTRAADAYSPECVGYGVSGTLACRWTAHGADMHTGRRCGLRCLRGLSHRECHTTCWVRGRGHAGRRVDSWYVFLAAKCGGCCF